MNSLESGNKPSLEERRQRMIQETSVVLDLYRKKILTKEEMEKALQVRAAQVGLHTYILKRESRIYLMAGDVANAITQHEHKLIEDKDYEKVVGKCAINAEIDVEVLETLAEGRLKEYRIQ